MNHELTNTSEELIMAQAQRDQKALRMEQLAQQHGVDGITDKPSSSQAPEMAVITGHLHRIAALEKEVKHLKQVQFLQHCASCMSCGEKGNQRACLAAGTLIKNLHKKDLCTTAGYDTVIDHNIVKQASCSA